MDLLDLERIDPLNGAYIYGELAAQSPSDMQADDSYAAMVTELPAKDVSLKLLLRFLDAPYER